MVKKRLTPAIYLTLRYLLNMKYLGTGTYLPINVKNIGIAETFLCERNTVIKYNLKLTSHTVSSRRGAGSDRPRLRLHGKINNFYVFTVYKCCESGFGFGSALIWLSRIRIGNADPDQILQICFSYKNLTFCDIEVRTGSGSALV